MCNFNPFASKKTRLRLVFRNLAGSSKLNRFLLWFRIFLDTPAQKTSLPSQGARNRPQKPSKKHRDLLVSTKVREKRGVVGESCCALAAAAMTRGDLLGETGKQKRDDLRMCWKISCCSWISSCIVSYVELTEPSVSAFKTP